MSHSCDEAYDVYNEETRKARIAHTCDACDTEISPGHVYTSVHLVFDGRASTVKRCLRCQTIHLHLRELCRSTPDHYGLGLWPDEELRCGEDYEENWGAAPPPDIAALAFMSPEEVQVALRRGTK